MYPDRGNRYIYCSSLNKRGLEEIRELLLSVGIQTGMARMETCWRIGIGGRKRLERFARLINFSIKRKRDKLTFGLDTYKKPF